MIDFSALSAPFPPSQVSWRIGPTNADKTEGLALAYLDARDVMDRLDAVCGAGGWQCRYSHAGTVTVCEIGIAIIREPEGIVDWVWKADGADQSDMEAVKGGLSDAFKRAAVRWGIGRYLYHIASPWVQIQSRGKTSYIRDGEYKRLEALLADINPKVIQRPTTPAANPDVVEGAKRWVADQQNLLSQPLNLEDTEGWRKTNQKALTKLKQNHLELYDSLMMTYETKVEALKAL